MSLTIKKIEALKPKDKKYDVMDDRGLHIHVSVAGSKIWKFRYFLDGEKRITLGKYPALSLQDARALAEEKRKLVSEGKDPRVRKQKTTNTFWPMALEWMEFREKTLDEKTCKATRSRLEANISKDFRRKDMDAIEPADVLKEIRAIEARGTYEVSHAVYGYVRGIFSYAVASSKAKRNPANDISAAVIKPQRKKNFAYVEPSKLPDFLYDLEQWNGGIVTKAAAQFLFYVFIRTDEMRFTPWSEVEHLLQPDTDGLWRIPKERMKGGKYPHIVPMSRQAIEILRMLKPITGRFPFVFANLQRPLQPISENGVLQVMYSMGYKGEMTGHGMRHLASTILNENEHNHDWSEDAIERQMHHVPKGTRADYNHAKYMGLRTKMMQWWADHLDELRASCKRS